MIRCLLEIRKNPASGILRLRRIAFYVIGALPYDIRRKTSLDRIVSCGTISTECGLYHCALSSFCGTAESCCTSRRRHHDRLRSWYNSLVSEEIEAYSSKYCCKPLKKAMTALVRTHFPAERGNRQAASFLWFRWQLNFPRELHF